MCECTGPVQCTDRDRLSIAATYVVPSLEHGRHSKTLNVLAIDAAVNGNPTADTLFVGVRKERVERELLARVDLWLECERCRGMLEIETFIFVAGLESGDLTGPIAVTRGSISWVGAKRSMRVYAQKD